MCVEVWAVVFCVFYGSLSRCLVVLGAMRLVPPNTAAVVGSIVSFQCHSDTNSTFRWYHFTPGSNTDNKVVHTGKKRNEAVYDERFQVTFNNSTGWTELTINDVQLSDAGIYCCYEIRTSESQKPTAELVVLGECSGVR